MEMSADRPTTCRNCGDRIAWHVVARRWTHEGRSSWCDEGAQGYDRPKAAK